MRYLKKYEFVCLVEEAVKGLTPKGKELLKEVVLDVEPRAKELPKMQTWGVLAQFYGATKIQPSIMPPKIVLYQEDIEFTNRSCSKKSMIEHITTIISHELIHYLGANEFYADKFRREFIKTFKKDPKITIRKLSWWEKLKRLL